MKIEVDTDKCVAAGLCVMAAETVFDQDPDSGTVVLLTDEPAPGDEEDVRKAASVCPALAITLHETGAVPQAAAAEPTSTPGDLS